MKLLTSISCSSILCQSSLMTGLTTTAGNFFFPSTISTIFPSSLSLSHLSLNSTLFFWFSSCLAALLILASRLVITDGFGVIFVFLGFEGEGVG